MVLRTEALEIDDSILEEIESRDLISFAEVEEACLPDRRHIGRGREGLRKVSSWAAAGCYVLVVLINLGGGNWRMVAAPDTSDSERRLYIGARGDR